MARRRAPALPIRFIDGAYEVNIDRVERAVLLRLLDDMVELLAGPPDQPALRRMFPPAYHLDDDAEAEAEYQRLMREELVASRLAAVAAVHSALDRQVSLDDEGLVAFMQAVNGVRLVIGTLLDVDEQHDIDAVADDDPLIGEHHLYGYLSYLLDAAIQATSNR